MTNAIIKGSLGAIARASNKSIAETFASADCIIIIDTSGSMQSKDSRDDRSRYDVACEELANIQNSMPGKIAVLAFSDSVIFCPNGQPYNFGGSTDLASALKYARVADVPGMRFILISDGEPNDEKHALSEARLYKNRIDVIYVGPELEQSGRDFLNRLANTTGGKYVTVDRAKELAASVERLLLDAGV